MGHQANTIICDDHLIAAFLVLDSSHLDGYAALAIVGKRVLQRIGNQLVDDQSERQCRVEGKGNVIRHIHVNPDSTSCSGVHALQFLCQRLDVTSKLNIRKTL